LQLCIAIGKAPAVMETTNSSTQIRNTMYENINKVQLVGRLGVMLRKYAPSRAE
jgi:hypothetical protein